MGGKNDGFPRKDEDEWMGSEKNVGLINVQIYVLCSKFPQEYYDTDLSIFWQFSTDYRCL